MNIQLFAPTFKIDECLKEIRDCLEKGWTGLGYKTVEFEENWKKYIGLKNAHFLNSATVGLHLAVKILKMEKGWDNKDEVISTPLTFVSTNHAIMYENLKVVFADVDEYLCLDPADVEKKITPKTKAILFVGLGGNVGRYEEIVKLCRRHNLALILDAAHMSGTRFNKNTPGKEADVVVYSFQAVKNLPTADSGMICFKDKKYDEIARKLSWLGINKDTYARTNSTGTYKWRYDVEYVGYKYHGNSIMAAIGLVQLKYLDQDNEYRRQLATWYDYYFLRKDSKVKPVPIAKGCEPSRHLYMILANNRDELMLALNENGVFPGVHYQDNTTYKMYSYGYGTCPNSHKYSQNVLSLPMHLRLKKEDVNYISELIIKYSK